MIRWAQRSGHRFFVLALMALPVVQCGGRTRFALRPPVSREPDDRVFSRIPDERLSGDLESGMDEVALRRLSHSLLFEPSRAAANVNALDEVPDSTWYTNRRPTPEQSAIGPCTDAPTIAPPFSIVSVKSTGYTAGFDVTDANGNGYILKYEQNPRVQPEVNSAADAIGARLYWSLGYNTPCNRVSDISDSDLRLTSRLYLSPDRLRRMLQRVVHGPDGRARISASLLVTGKPIGPWPAVGTRGDDPNDAVRHEHRRELRGERVIAAWINHWDVRPPNSLDTFVRGPGGTGYVRHWMIDFGDCFGTLETDGDARSRRLGHESILSPGRIAEDLMGFGFVRRSWDENSMDRRYPDLGYFDTRHFDPASWEPLIPSSRFAEAQNQDIGWMARKVARITPDHLRAMVQTGRFSNPEEEHRLLEVLLQRRDKVLRWAFRASSPLGEPRMARKDVVCAVDLALASGVSSQDRTAYTADLRAGEHLSRSTRNPILRRGASFGEVCVQLSHFAPDGAPDDSPARYAVLDIGRVETDREVLRTRMRLHFYDLGPARGYALVGVER